MQSSRPRRSVVQHVVVAHADHVYAGIEQAVHQSGTSPEHRPRRVDRGAQVGDGSFEIHERHGGGGEELLDVLEERFTAVRVDIGAHLSATQHVASGRHRKQGGVSGWERGLC